MQAKINSNICSQHLHRHRENDHELPNLRKQMDELRLHWT